MSEEKDHDPRSRTEQRLVDSVNELKTLPPGPRYQAIHNEMYGILWQYISRSRVARSVPDFKREELFHEAMIAFWRALGNFRGDSRVTTFVHAIFRNKCADYIATDSYDLSEHVEVDETVASAEKSVCDQLSQREVMGFLAKCMARFRDKYPNAAYAIDLHKLEYSTAEIGVALGRPKGTVERWLFEARGDLESCLRRHRVTSSGG